MDDDDNDINEYVPSLLNPRRIKKQDFSLTQNSIKSRYSLSLKRSNVLSQRNSLKNEAVFNKKFALPDIIPKVDKENLPTDSKHETQLNKNVILKMAKEIPIGLTQERFKKKLTLKRSSSLEDSLGFSAVEDFQTNYESSPFTFQDQALPTKAINIGIKDNPIERTQKSIISVSSATEVYEHAKSVTHLEHIDSSLHNISFCINNCDSVDVSAKNGAIKRFVVTPDNGNIIVDCEVYDTLPLDNHDSSQISTKSQEVGVEMNKTSPSPLKRLAVPVTLEIKKPKLSATGRRGNSKVLILNTKAKVQFRSHNKSVGNGNCGAGLKQLNCGAGLKQLQIDSYFHRSHVPIDVPDKFEDAEEMSRNSGVSDAIKCDRVTKSAKILRRGSIIQTPKSARQLSTGDVVSPRRDVKFWSSEAHSPVRVGGTLSPRKNVDSVQFSRPLVKTKSIRTSLSPRSIIPFHKIVAGTHLAVDAFSYGDIPNVKHYFLTHFHSDHYTGLKKSFNKLLFCSKITADLCTSRLGVNSKFIQIIAVDETLNVDGVEVTAVDANHCPGALMLVFTLPNGKSLLHTGDFRASPLMESYPVFWNRDIHTIYLDTTYCNPRYDFPTQDQSLEMAVYILMQKKMELDKVGKKFASVLIVCGTYTIGKEKFFLGVSRRVGCAVWACPEKERVLQIVEGKACSRDAPHACQLHVVPMRDLTHEKLRSYLDSLQGAFSEVVAFKPSGWENGKTAGVEKDCVTIHVLPELDSLKDAFSEVLAFYLVAGRMETLRPWKSVTIHGIPYSEHSSFSEMVRFVNYLKPKQVVPNVCIYGGVKAVQKHFPCPLVIRDEPLCQTRMSDFFSINSCQQAAAVT